MVETEDMDEIETTAVDPVPLPDMEDVIWTEDTDEIDLALGIDVIIDEMVTMIDVIIDEMVAMIDVIIDEMVTMIVLNDVLTAEAEAVAEVEVDILGTDLGQDHKY